MHTLASVSTHNLVVCVASNWVLIGLMARRWWNWHTHTHTHTNTHTHEHIRTPTTHPPTHTRTCFAHTGDSKAAVMAKSSAEASAAARAQVQHMCVAVCWSVSAECVAECVVEGVAGVCGFVLQCLVDLFPSAYGVATISKLLKMIGLFCKKAL